MQVITKSIDIKDGSGFRQYDKRWFQLYVIPALLKYGTSRAATLGEEFKSYVLERRVPKCRYENFFVEIEGRNNVVWLH